ncbi:MAG: hypothetical protein JWR52_1778 [Marmoricola sp.]|nr:hypothetical protein [Marmoricola sp.]
MCHCGQAVRVVTLSAKPSSIARTVLKLSPFDMPTILHDPVLVLTVVGDPDGRCTNLRLRTERIVADPNAQQSQGYLVRMEFKNHLAPFIGFGGLGVYGLWYVVKSLIAWRRDGSLGVRNTLRWMPLGPTVTIIVELASGEDPTKDRPVHELKNPVVIVLWLVVCLAFAAATLFAAYNFLRFGHSF